MNKARLRRVKTLIRKEAERFDMNFFVMPARIAKEFKNVCGTIHCIGGFAAVDAGALKARIKSDEMLGDIYRHDVLKQFDLDPYSDALGDLPTELLDLTRSQADRLFYHDEWPEEFYVRYKEATTPQERAKVACDRIDRFIESNGRV